MNTKVGFSAAFLAGVLSMGAMATAGAQDVLVTNSNWTSGIYAGSNHSKSLESLLSLPNTLPQVGPVLNLGTILTNVPPNGSVVNGTYTTNADLDFVVYNPVTKVGNDFQGVATLTEVKVAGKYATDVNFISLTESNSVAYAPAGLGLTAGSGSGTATTGTDPNDGLTALKYTLSPGVTFYLDKTYVDPTYIPGGSYNPDISAYIASPVPEFGSCASLATVLTGSGAFGLFFRRRRSK